MKVFISDCEGPISKNDNAFEITSNFIPNGDKLFAVISGYDDVLAYVVKRPCYKAGDTLKLILPFLKAYGVTDKKMQEFSAKNLILISDAEKMLRNVRKITRAFIVSTSYEHYIKALCKTINFPYKNTYCTRLSIDKCHIAEDEKMQLIQLAEEIARMPIIEVPQEAKSLGDLRNEQQKVVQRLDEIFWGKIANMKSGRFFSEVNPIGGTEKAKAVQDIVSKVGAEMTDVMYVGDSITDVDAFRLVREGGGLTVSFNGNQYAVKNAEVAVLSNNCAVISIIAEIFTKFGKKQTLNLVENWGIEALKQAKISSKSIKRLLSFGDLPKVKITTKENIEALMKESSEFRKKVRGEVIGRLG